MPVRRSGSLSYGLVSRPTAVFEVTKIPIDTALYCFIMILIR